MLNRKGKDKDFKSSVFQRLKGDRQLKSSVVTKITGGKNSSASSPTQVRISVFNCLGETNEFQSSIPSCMKPVYILNIKSDGSLKVKRHTLVIIYCEISSNSKDKVKDEEQVSSN